MLLGVGVERVVVEVGVGIVGLEPIVGSIRAHWTSWELGHEESVDLGMLSSTSFFVRASANWRHVAWVRSGWAILATPIPTSIDVVGLRDLDLLVACGL